MGEPRHVPDFRHELGAERIPYTVHLHNDRELRELGCQFQHLSLELFYSPGNSIEGINGLPDQPLGQIVLWYHGNLVFRSGIDFGSFVAAEIVAVSLAPLAVTLREGGLAHTPDTVYVPKRRGKVHPLLRPILTGRAAEQGVDTGVGLIQEGDEVVLHRGFHLGVQSVLPVQRFQLVTNHIHGSILPQFSPVVKAIFRNFLGIGLVGLDLAQRVVSIVLDKFRIHRADVQPRVMEELSHRLIVPSGMLHDYPRLTVQAFQVVCQLLEFTAGVTHSKRFCHHLAQRPHNRYHALPLGNINPRCVHCLTLLS